MKLSKIQNKKYLTLIAILWPFLGLILAMKYFNKFNTKNIILLFFGLFGFSLIVNPEMDSMRYVERLNDDFGKPYNETAFYYGITNLYESSLDFFQPLLTFLISRFTDSSHILFAVYALLFGFFWLRTLSYINKNFRFNENFITLFYAAFLIAIIPITNINGFRMWTAAWVFMYGAFHVIFTKNSKYFIYCIAACTIHFSFLSANIILLIWFVFGNHKWVYLVLALISFMMAELDLSAVRSFAESLSPALSSKANAYTNEEYVADVAELRKNDVWFMVWSPILTKYLLLINTLIVFYITCKSKLDKKSYNLLNFSLLFLFFANIMGLMPSGGRFTVVYNVFGAVLSIILFSKYYSIKIHSLHGLFSLITILLAILIVFRVGAPTINTIIFAPSFLIPFGYNLDWPIANWLF